MRRGLPALATSAAVMLAGERRHRDADRLLAIADPARERRQDVRRRCALGRGCAPSVHRDGVRRGSSEPVSADFPVKQGKNREF